MSAHTGNTVREPEPEPTFIEILSNIILFTAARHECKASCDDSEQLYELCPYHEQ